jgi:hypothetical protein
VFGTTDW